MASAQILDLTIFGREPIAVLGYGKSGAASAATLARSGCVVRIWDDVRERREAAQSAGFTLADFSQADLADYSMILLSPGIPARGPNIHPIVARARAEGVDIVCDIDLLFRACPQATYIGITGTNGKSTTTSLLGHILDNCDRPFAVGGNIGTPALDLPPLPADGIYVLEISSYQLELLPTTAFDIAILLNISPDHLDHHDGMAGYIEAKRRIFAHQPRQSTAIIGVDTEPSRAIFNDLTGRKMDRIWPISGMSGEAAQGGIYVENGRLTDATLTPVTPVLPLDGITALTGNHNWENAAAAYGAAIALDLPAAKIAGGLRSYPGLAHRQELIATIDGVQFINDSKATNIDAATRALACYDNIYWIAGGRAKDQQCDMTAITALSQRLRHAYLIGEASGLFANCLDGAIETSQCGDLDHALAGAVDAAKRDPSGNAVVLLSPAAASFDQFDNFEQRGDAFRSAVMRLKTPAARGQNANTTATRTYA